MKNHIIYMVVIFLIGLTIAISCRKDTIIYSEVQSLSLKGAPDTNWHDIGYIDAYENVILSVSYSALISEIENDWETWYDDSTDNSNLYMEIDTMYFLKYYRTMPDTLENIYSFYLIVEGEILDDQFEEEPLWVRTAMTGVEILDNDVYFLDTDAPCIKTTIHWCEPYPCTNCEYTYGWVWGGGTGPINGCNCSQSPPCSLCNCLYHRRDIITHTWCN